MVSDLRKLRTSEGFFECTCWRNTNWCSLRTKSDIRASFVGNDRIPEFAVSFCTGLWQVVAMVSLKFQPGPLCPNLLRPAGGPTLKLLRPFQGWPAGRPQGGRPAAAFYLGGHPTPHAVRFSVTINVIVTDLALVGKS
jgi:hypothetical protein